MGRKIFIPGGTEDHRVNLSAGRRRRGLCAPISKAATRYARIRSKKERDKEDRNKKNAEKYINDGFAVTHNAPANR